MLRGLFRERKDLDKRVRVGIANAKIVLSLLNGKETGPKRDAVLLNAAAALFVAHRAKTLIEGWDIAADILASGAAAEKLGELRSFSARKGVGPWY